LIAPPLAYRSPSAAAAGATKPGQQRWRRFADELGYEPWVGDQAMDVYLVSLGPTRGAWSLTDGLAGLTADVLFMASVDDERFDAASARAIAEHLPNAAMVELTGLDHRASARDSTAVAAIIEFLEHGR
ncbi:MAG: alpha/beta fold hydrolase, partial [Acidimicrobiales bacterium]